MILGMSCGRDELRVEFMAGISEGWMTSVAASSTRRLRSVETLWRARVKKTMVARKKTRWLRRMSDVRRCVGEGGLRVLADEA